MVLTIIINKTSQTELKINMWKKMKKNDICPNE